MMEFNIGTIIFQLIVFIILILIICVIILGLITLSRRSKSVQKLEKQNE